MYIPMWLILFVVFLFNPDIAFILAIIYCCIHSPITAIILLGIYLLFVLFFKSCDFWAENVSPKIEKITRSDMFKQTKRMLLKLFIWSFYLMAAALLLFEIIYLCAD